MCFDEFYNNLNPEIKEYYKILSPSFPGFLKRFIESKSMQRLSKVSYFCGAIYASKSIYDFKYDVSRLEHSISTALITYHFTMDPAQTIAALLHDVTTPAFSHVIDYLNGDTLKQESTELNLEEYLKTNDPELVNLLKENNLTFNEINYKNYSLVDKDRPSLCADRIDALFLANLAWTKETNIEEIKSIYKDLCVVDNNDKKEFAFNNENILNRAVELNDIINDKTHSNEDFVSMNCLAVLVKRLIQLKVLSYNDLFTLTDNEVYDLIIKNISEDEKLCNLFIKFNNLTKKQANDIYVDKTKIKNKNLKPLISNKGDKL